ncbi:helix-turn-helix domain-containing protein [Plantactinospora sp. WMMB334]|uniref:helix-turn-helix domain-containing protein n=1 Tax=Plantactinospora sp. WMMB334 TaxID=3404119 RepID=UPI003B92E44E
MDRLTGPGLSDDLPVGRRVAYWRGQRRMSQQVLADRLGKSKSWVDKVERGVRTLDKLSVLREIADVLRISAAQLIGAADAGRDRPGPTPEVAALRAALTRYEVRLGRRPVRVPSAAELEQAVAHAWLSLGRADYTPLLRSLPELICAAQWRRAGARTDARTDAPADTQTDAQTDAPADARADGPDRRSDVLLGQVYQIAAEVLRRLDVPDLAWLAADRAMGVGADSDEPWWAARAAIPLADVVREIGRPRHAYELCIVTAHRLAGTAGLSLKPAASPNPPAGTVGPNPPPAPAEHLSVYGTLLLHAALSAAALGDRASTIELLDQARAVARTVGPGHDHYRTCFGPALVEIVGVAVAVELGDGEQTRAGAAERAADRDHQRLPIAVRAAYLLDLARAHLQAGDPVAAGRAVVAAERTAAAEVRARPAARGLLGAVLRAADRPEPSVARLAEALGVTV